MFFTIAGCAVFFGPNLINWNNYKSVITNQVHGMTGRKLTINGDIEVSILPKPKILIKKVALSNVKGATSKSMLKLESAEINIALSQLISGKIRFQEIELIKPSSQFLELSLLGKSSLKNTKIDFLKPISTRF